MFYSLQGLNVLLNAQKNYISLYVGDRHKIDPEMKLLKGLNLGKGCIRISKSKSIPDYDQRIIDRES